MNESVQRCSAAPEDDEVARMRAWQIQAALPHVGPLLDRWENMSNDVKGSLRNDDEAFCELLDALEAAWMSEPPFMMLSCRGSGE